MSAPLPSMKPLPDLWLAFGRELPPRPTEPAPKGRMWLFCRVCGQWRAVRRSRRVTCSRTCRNRLNAWRAAQRRGLCVRPGCRRYKRLRCKTCGPACATWLRKHNTLGRPKSKAARSKPCKVCSRMIHKAYPCELRKVATCGKFCEGVLKRRKRLERLLSVGLRNVHRIPASDAFVLGFTMGLRADRRCGLRERHVARAKKALEALDG